ncbi:MAG: GNAT family N-acetyltransferase [Flavobacteriales bacterium]|jgi:GNAT superfamily N-acetyltransferase|nr:GNAT family N-acetyltransferase [Flavobacteriales bacterium]
MAALNIIECLALDKEQKQAIKELWNNEYPAKLQHESLDDFSSYLHGLGDQNHLLLLIDNEIKGWYFDFSREGEKWFALILNSDIQGKGYGSQIMDRIKSSERELNGWVIDHNNDLKSNGERYQSPLEFYTKNGFDIISDVRLELDKISAVKIKWTK